MPTRRSKTLRCLLALVMAAAIFVVLCKVYVRVKTEGKVQQSLNLLPSRINGVLLGTDQILPNGSTNFHFMARIDAACRLLMNNQNAGLLITGNPRNKGFNEPQQMRAQIMARGIDPQRLSIDETGITTRASARRARDEGFKEVTVITDPFHARRAVFLFQAYGIDAIAYCAEDEPNSGWSMWFKLREALACSKAVLEVIALKLGIVK